MLEPVDSLGDMQEMMKKTDVFKQYSMEDLIPIVGTLAEKFTAKESSSITYDKARQFMEAVIYCIAHCEVRSNSIITTNVLPAKDVYQLGYNTVIETVQKTQNKYNQLMEFFDHYNNLNYQDTVEKALSGFFLYYDVKFAPMDHIITMDYPVFGLNLTLEGIDLIKQYIDAIWEEQSYLMRFPRNYIISELRSFHPHYEKEFINLKEILELQRSKEC